MDRRPGPWLRALYRAPVVLYRHGFAGWEPWFGMRWLLIVTHGRRSGREHAVLVDLLGEEAGRRYFVQSAYGRNSDWVRNIEARPVFEAQVLKESFSARLEEVSPAEARRVMTDYVRAHRLYSPFIARMLGYRGSLGSSDDVAEWLIEEFGMLAVVRVPSS